MDGGGKLLCADIMWFVFHIGTFKLRSITTIVVAILVLRCLSHLHCNDNCSCISYPQLFALQRNHNHDHIRNLKPCPVPWLIISPIMFADIKWRTLMLINYQPNYVCWYQVNTSIGKVLNCGLHHIMWPLYCNCGHRRNHIKSQLWCCTNSYKLTAT